MAYQATEQRFHAGELAMHHLMNAPTSPHYPNSPYLVPRGAMLISQSPMQAVGVLDENQRPWTTIWTGEAGFCRPVTIGKEGGKRAGGFAIQCLVDGGYDPVVSIIKENTKRKEPSTASGLAIDLMNRDRVKWAGKILGADLRSAGAEEQGNSNTTSMQAVVEVESSLMNCPKYLNKIPLKTGLPVPIMQSQSTAMPSGSFSTEAASLIAAAPLCFLTASHNGTTLSTNHRGGSPGFLRLVVPNELGSKEKDTLPIPTQNPILVLPEYSGNRFYQTLGNAHETPYIGVVVPDFRNGDLFYATSFVRILSGTEAARFMPRTNLCLVMELLEWRLVKHGLGGTIAGMEEDKWEEAVDWSPYNPPVRYLSVEQRTHGLPTPPPEGSSNSIGVATLANKTDLGPGIARFAFDLAPNRGSGIPPWTAGQYVVLDFNPELGQGYIHMQDDDPTILNDDLIRTFTISSAPAESTFEITIRNVGRCTNYLFRANVRAGLEFPVIAFGGSFTIEDGPTERAKEERLSPANTMGFIGGGMGITPLLAQMPGLRESGRGVRVWWSLRMDELGFALKVIQAWIRLDKKGSTAASADTPRGELDVRLFVSGTDKGIPEMQPVVSSLEGCGVRIERRRLQHEDLLNDNIQDAGTFYLCAGKSLTQAVDGWLAKEGKAVVSESFNF